MPVCVSERGREREGEGEREREKEREKERWHPMKLYSLSTHSPITLVMGMHE